jgi:hypothetical protein
MNSFAQRHIPLFASGSMNHRLRQASRTAASAQLLSVPCHQTTAVQASACEHIVNARANQPGTDSNLTVPLAAQAPEIPSLRSYARALPGPATRPCSPCHKVGTLFGGLNLFQFEAIPIVPRNKRPLPTSAKHISPHCNLSLQGMDNSDSDGCCTAFGSANN